MRQEEEEEEEEAALPLLPIIIAPALPHFGETRKRAVVRKRKLPPAADDGYPNRRLSTSILRPAPPLNKQTK